MEFNSAFKALKCPSEMERACNSKKFWSFVFML